MTRAGSKAHPSSTPPIRSPNVLGRRVGLALIAGLLLVLVAAAKRSGPSLPRLQQLHPGEHLVVLAPHPDDETLAAGGLMQRARSRGARVRVVFLTSGDGFRVAAAEGTGRETPGPADYLRLAHEREREARAAAARLGLPAAQLIFLRYPDQGLLPLWLDCWEGPEAYVSLHTGRAETPADTSGPGRPYLGARLLEDLRVLLRSEQPSILCLPAAQEGTADHWAAHLFGISALAQAGMLGRVRVLTYLVHHEGWPGWFRWPGHDTLEPPRDLPPASWTRFPLGAPERQAKRAALEEYRTQTAVMGGRLRRFDRANELFAPLAVPTLPRHPDETAASSLEGGELAVSRRGDRLQARFCLNHGEWRAARLHLHLLTPAGKVRWDFLPDAPPPRGGESRIQGRAWEVAVPLPAEGTPFWGLWVGAERYPEGRPVEDLGWIFYSAPSADQSKMTPRAAERSRARAA
jgi:LmbE family N-acetylglucosaminyl deacetylase